MSVNIIQIRYYASIYKLGWFDISQSGLDDMISMCEFWDLHLGGLESIEGKLGLTDWWTEKEKSARYNYLNQSYASTPLMLVKKSYTVDCRIIWKAIDSMK